MDKSQVKAIVDREIEPLMRRLGIGHWKVRVAYDPEPAGDDGRIKHGECTRLIDYNMAFISLNPESFDDEADVLKTLRHEFFHIVLSPFDLFMQAADQLTKKGGAKEAMLRRVSDHAVEKAVINLERMWHGLTETGAVPPSTPAPEGSNP